jgi:hypothetical protein
VGDAANRGFAALLASFSRHDEIVAETNRSWGQEVRWTLVPAGRSGSPCHASREYQDSWSPEQTALVLRGGSVTGCRDREAGSFEMQPHLKARNGSPDADLYLARLGLAAQCAIFHVPSTSTKILVRNTSPRGLATTQRRPGWRSPAGCRAVGHGLNSRHWLSLQETSSSSRPPQQKARHPVEASTRQGAQGEEHACTNRTADRLIPGGKRRKGHQI